MARQHTRNLGTWARIQREIRRDPKKAWVLGTLLVLLGGICAWEVVSRIGPATAGAATPRPAGVAERADAPDPQDGDVSPWGGATPATGPALSAPASRSVDRDLFTPNPVYFPPHRPGKAVAKVLNDGPTSEEREKARRRDVQAQAQSLALQSTVIGAEPTAIVNGRVLRAGEWINAFRVVEITTYRCVVEKDGVQVALELSK